MYDQNLRDPIEEARVIDIASRASAYEMERMFRRGVAQQIARKLGVRYMANGRQQCQQLFAYFREHERQLPDNGEPRKCNCQIPEGLRWKKADDGEPVTWSVELESQHANMFPLIIECMQQATAIISAKCDIKFEQVSEGGDIVVRFAELDGAGGTLGVAYMPRGGDDMDQFDLSGDFIYDSAEAWHPQLKLDVTVHELWHCIGGNHNEDDPESIFHPSLSGAGTQSITKKDERDMLTKYPFDDTPKIT